MPSFRHQNLTLQLVRDRPNLVISVGDSWTFGDSLGTIAHDKDIDDYDARLAQCYGRRLADHLDADWFNWGKCGGGNLDIVCALYNYVLGHHTPFLTQENYNLIRDPGWPELVTDAHADTDIESQLVRHCTIKPPIDLSRYNRIFVFTTLTETGRNSAFYKALGKTVPTDVTQYLEQEEQFVYDLLAKLRENISCDLIVGRNFTVDLPSTTNSELDSLQSWIEINYHHNEKNNQDHKTITLDQILISGAASGIAFNRLNDPEGYFSNYREYMIDQVTRADACWAWLKSNPLNHNQATCHPTEKSHQLWAEQLLNFVGLENRIISKHI